MKKVLFMIGALCLLFGISFVCSYGIYKKSSEYTDASEQLPSMEKSSDSYEEASGKPAKETIETITKQDAATDTGTTEAEAACRYLVSSLNGYVAVFTASGSLYEFTDIKLSDLENDMKERILNGIKFQKEKELFTFLESCSS